MFLTQNASHDPATTTRGSGPPPPPNDNGDDDDDDRKSSRPDFDPTERRHQKSFVHDDPDLLQFLQPQTVQEVFQEIDDIQSALEALIHVEKQRQYGPERKSPLPNSDSQGSLG